MIARLFPSLQHPRSPLADRICSFWEAPVAPRPLALFRIGLSAVLLVKAISIMGHLNDLYGRHGIVEWSVMSENRPPGLPNLSWVDSALNWVGLSPALAVPLSFSVYVAALIGLLLGQSTRLSAGVAWLAHTTLLTSSVMSIYGVDRFAQIGLFYCLCFPVGHALSLDAGNGRVAPGPSFQAWFGLRMLQLHVCIIYVACGVEKAVGTAWWSGEALWQALMTSYYGPVDCSILASAPWLAQGLGWMTLLLEAGVILFVWHPRARLVWVVGIVGMHLGIAVLMSLWTFSAIMIVFDVAAFGIPPRRLVKATNSATVRSRTTAGHSDTIEIVSGAHSVLHVKETG